MKPTVFPKKHQRKLSHVGFFYVTIVPGSFNPERITNSFKSILDRDANQLRFWLSKWPRSNDKQISVCRPRNLAHMYDFHVAKLSAYTSVNTLTIICYPIPFSLCDIVVSCLHLVCLGRISALLLHNLKPYYKSKHLSFEHRVSFSSL